MHPTHIFREKVEIKHLINIKHAIIEPKPFTLLIGKNASGKSLVVRVTYLLRKHVNHILNFLILKELQDEPLVSYDTIKSLLDHLKSKFTDTFPIEYLINKGTSMPMELSYSIDAFELRALCTNQKCVKSTIHYKITFIAVLTIFFIR